MLFAIEKAPLPDFKVDQRPETLRMVFASPVPAHQLANKLFIENFSFSGAFTQDVLIDDMTEFTPQPPAYRNRKSHLLSCNYLLRENSIDCAAQNVLRFNAVQFHRDRKSCRKLYELVIQKGHPA